MRIVFSLLFILTAALLFAADPPKGDRDEKWHKELAAQFTKGDRWAVLIGVDTYKTRPLVGPVSNVLLFKEVLPKYCGFHPDRIKVLTDEAATKDAITSALREVAKDAGRNDTILISFNGHGAEVEGLSYLCAFDYESGRGKETGVRTDDLRAILHECKAAQKLLFIESCHSGGATAVGMSQPSSQELAGPFSKAGGLVTFASCRLKQTSMGYGGKGVFTSLLAEGLAGAADFDKNGIVDSDELYRHLVMEVPHTVQHIDPKHEQVPVRIIGEDVVGVFALSRPDGKEIPEYFKLPLRPKVGDVVANSVGMKLVYLPSEGFVYGSPKSEYLRNDDEAQHPILINKPIYLGIHEVTQAHYLKVMGKNPSYYSEAGGGVDAGTDTANLPVEQVSWKDAVAFCEKLSALPEEKQARRAYRLPTEAEWEFACRAGTQTVFATGDKLSSKQANIRGDKTYLDSDEGPTLGRTTAVGSYKPNAFGLYDMHGNVAEWCSDYYTARRFPSWVMSEGHSVLKMVDSIVHRDAMEKTKIGERLASPLNPTGPSEGTSRVYRGGAFTGDVALARSACRRDKAEDYAYRGIGFRVVCYTSLKD